MVFMEKKYNYNNYTNEVVRGEKQFAYFVILKYVTIFCSSPILIISSKCSKILIRYNDLKLISYFFVLAKRYILGCKN